MNTRGVHGHVEGERGTRGGRRLARAGCARADRREIGRARHARVSGIGQSVRRMRRGALGVQGARAWGARAGRKGK